MPPTRTSKRVWYNEYRRPKRDAGRPYMSDENAGSSREVFVHSPYLATRVVKWSRGCVSRNQPRRGAYCWGFLASVLISHTLMYGFNGVINITRICQVLNEILRAFVTDNIQKVYTCLFVHLLLVVVSNFIYPEFRTFLYQFCLIS